MHLRWRLKEGCLTAGEFTCSGIGQIRCDWAFSLPLLLVFYLFFSFLTCALKRLEVSWAFSGVVATYAGRCLALAACQYVKSSIVELAHIDPIQSAPQPPPYVSVFSSGKQFMLRLIASGNILLVPLVVGVDKYDMLTWVVLVPFCHGPLTAP